MGDLVIDLKRLPPHTHTSVTQCHAKVRGPHAGHTPARGTYSAGLTPSAYAVQLLPDVHSAGRLANVARVVALGNV